MKKFTLVILSSMVLMSGACFAARSQSTEEGRELYREFYARIVSVQAIRNERLVLDFCGDFNSLLSKALVSLRTVERGSDNDFRAVDENFQKVEAWLRINVCGHRYPAMKAQVRNFRALLSEREKFYPGLRSLPKKHNTTQERNN